MDVITAYLLEELDEEIYMMQPEGFIQMEKKQNMVCRLLRSLYGLKQAGRTWNQRIDFELKAKDVVFVDTAAVVRWGRVINNVVPTAQAVYFGKAAANY